MTRLVGICGLGSIGQRHARVFSELPDVTVAAFDPAQAAASIPGVVHASSLEELLAMRPVAVVVASPDEFHEAAAVAACRAGIPVLVEKPLAATVDGALAIAAASAESGTPVLVGYVLRSYSVMRRAHELIASGGIGLPVSGHAMLGAYETLVVARNRFDVPREGRLYFDYSHEWDYLRWLLGPIEGGYAVARRGGSLPLQQDPNVVAAVLSFVDGAVCTVNLDYVQLPGRRSFTVIGDEATLDVDVPAGELVVTDRRGHAVRETLGEPRDVPFRSQALHLLDVAAGGSEPRVGLLDGIAAMQAATALRESASTGRWQALSEPSIRRPPGG